MRIGERIFPRGRIQRPHTGLILAVLLAFACCPAYRSQSGSGSGVRQSQEQFPGRPGFGSPGDNDPLMTQKRLFALNVERQKQIVAETNKLLRLARELNEEVAASNTGRLTPAELHKVAEIEKLARSVKERMVAAVLQPESALPLPGFNIPAH